VRSGTVGDQHACRGNAVGCEGSGTEASVRDVEGARDMSGLVMLLGSGVDDGESGDPGTEVGEDVRTVGFKGQAVAIVGGGSRRRRWGVLECVRSGSHGTRLVRKRGPANGWIGTITYDPAMFCSHRLAALTAPGPSLFELAVVAEVFGLDRPDLQVDWWYAFEVFSAQPGQHLGLGGLRIDVTRGVEAIETAATIIIPGWPTDHDVPPHLIDAIRRAADDGKRLVSICSGAFVLAAAGLLDGKQATTHWMYADKLASRYPAVDVDPDVLFVIDDNIMTSAGSAAGIDLALHIVRVDHGARIANAVARRLVVTPVRDGGQAQFIEMPVAARDDDRIQRIIEWVSKDPSRPVTVAAAAARAHMSERTFSRRFKAVTGSSFWDWLIHLRLQTSLALLEAGTMPIDRVASEVGFTDPNTYRRHFRARLLTTPSAYRRTFGLKGGSTLG
jgi:AraC family transcriptional activator FtrA